MNSRRPRLCLAPLNAALQVRLPWRSPSDDVAAVSSLASSRAKPSTGLGTAVSVAVLVAGRCLETKLCGGGAHCEAEAVAMAATCTLQKPHSLPAKDGTKHSTTKHQHPPSGRF